MKKRKSKFFVITALLIFTVLILGVLLWLLNEKKKSEPKQQAQSETSVTETASEGKISEETTSEVQSGDGSSVSAQESQNDTSENGSTESESQGKTVEETSETEVPEKAEPDSSGYVILNKDPQVLYSVGSTDEDTKVQYERIRFTLPKNWTGSNQSDQNDCYFFYNDHAKMMLNKQFLGAGTDLDKEESLESCISGVEEGGFNNVKHERTVSVGDKNAYVLTGDAVVDGVQINGTVIYCQIGKNIYTFIFAEEEGYSYEDDINSFISSLEVCNQAGE